TGPHRFAGYSASGVACAFARGPAPPCGVAGSTRLRKLALTGSPAIPPPGSPAHSRGAPLHPAASPAQPICGNWPSPVRRLFRLRGRLRIRAGPRSTLRRRRLNPFAETGPHRFAGYSASGVAPRAFARGPAPPCGVAGSTRLRKLALTGSPDIPPPGSPPAHSREAPLDPAASPAQPVCGNLPSPIRRIFRLRGRPRAFARGPAPPCGVLQRKSHLADHGTRQAHAADAARAIAVAADDELAFRGQADQVLAEQAVDAVVEAHDVDRRDDPSAVDPERGE